MPVCSVSARKPLLISLDRDKIHKHMDMIILCIYLRFHVTGKLNILRRDMPRNRKILTNIYRSVVHRSFKGNPPLIQAANICLT